MITQSSARNAERQRNKEGGSMLKKSKYIALIYGVISIAVTVLLWLLICGGVFDDTMCWVSLLFLILAETIAAVKGFAVKRTIFGVSNITVSIVHVIAVFIISFIFVKFFPRPVNVYIILNILALCILLALDVVTVFFGNYVSAQNGRLEESRSVMDCCVEKAAALCTEFGGTEYGKDLEEILEMLKYSDNSCLSQDEMPIMNKLDEVRLLLQNNGDGIPEKIIEIKNAVRLRSIKISSAKRGSY